MSSRRPTNNKLASIGALVACLIFTTADMTLTGSSIAFFGVNAQDVTIFQPVVRRLEDEDEQQAEATATDGPDDTDIAPADSSTQDAPETEGDDTEDKVKKPTQEAKKAATTKKATTDKKVEVAKTVVKKEPSEDGDETAESTDAEETSADSTEETDDDQKKTVAAAAAAPKPKAASDSGEEGEETEESEKPEKSSEEEDAEEKPEVEEKSEDDEDAEEGADDSDELIEDLDDFDYEAAEAAEFAKQEEALKKKQPTLHMIQPKSRSYENYAINLEPCGTPDKEATHYMTEVGRIERFYWRTVKGQPHANCTMSISTGGDMMQDFHLLRPRDDSADLDGIFECGRRAGYESKEFRLPKGLVCDTCTLKMTWILNDQERVHQCSDLTIMDVLGEEDGSECSSQCLNGGVCQNGLCKCTNGFTGASCDEEEVHGSSSTMGWLILFSLIIGAAVIIYIFADKIKDAAGR